MKSLLLKALDYADMGQGFCAPNPAVGAILINDANEIIATGYHQGVGTPHAEVDALKKVSYEAKGLTMVVTLEPCNHHGRTPPCTEALIKAGVKKVIYGFKDPNPIVSVGDSTSVLAQAGIRADYFQVSEVTNFYRSYQHWHRHKLPFVTAKIALSLDGKIAGPNGERIQITGPALGEFVHQCRKKTDAILTTVKTVICDDPMLNVRLSGSQTYAKKIYVLDRQLAFPLDATLFETAQSITLFHGEKADAGRIETLKAKGVQCIPIQENPSQQLDLPSILQFIGKEGVHDLWVEAGGKCFSALWREGLINKALISVAPKWLGHAQSAFPPDFSLNIQDSSITWQQVGEDSLLEIYPTVSIGAASVSER